MPSLSFLFAQHATSLSNRQPPILHSFDIDASLLTPYYHAPQFIKHLSASAPYVLQESVPLCQSVDGVVALAHGAHETGHGVDVVLASVAAALVNLGDGDLYGCVVLGLDDAVGC